MQAREEGLMTNDPAGWCSAAEKAEAEVAEEKERRKFVDKMYVELPSR